MKKSYFILCCIALNVAAILSGLLGTDAKFLMIPILYFVVGIYLLKVNPFQNKKIGYILIFGLFPSLLFIAFIGSFFNKGFLGYPLVLVMAVTIPLAFLLYKRPVKLLVKPTILFVAALSIIAALLPNYYAYIFREHNINLGKPLPNLVIYDANKKEIDLKEKKGTIIVLDIWDSSCGICIKQFPKFEKLKNEFENDESIEFFNLNLPLKRDDRNSVDKLTEPYTFKKLYADDNVRKNLDINLLPQYMIIDKNSKIRYVGSLNTRDFDFYKNFYSMINDIKNEQ